jgi:hypothetical protein
MASMILNPLNGRWICTPESPMPVGADGLWEHENTVDDGECSDGCCDYRKCLDCGKRFRVEVAD